MIPDNKITVSVILATKNEEKNIKRCLNSLCGQSYNNLEIILVDNNSSDKTLVETSGFNLKVYKLHEHKNLSKLTNFRGAQVNFGFKQSKGEIVFFPDSDMTFDTNLIAEAVDLIVNHNNDALYVPEEIIGGGVLGKIRNFERSFYNQTSIDSVRFIRKDIFIKINGFDEDNINFGPDDWDITKKVKQVTNKITITNNKIFHHENFPSISDYLYKKYRYSDSFEPYIKKWGKEDPDVIKQLGFYYRYIGVYVENGNWIKLLKNPLLTIGMYILRIMVGINFLKYKILKGFS